MNGQPNQARKQKSIYPPLFCMLAVLIVLILTIFSVLFYRYVKETVKNADRASMNILNICERNLDYIMTTVDTEMKTLMYHAEDLAGYASENENTRYFATIRLIDIMNERIFLNQYIDVMLLMNRKQQTSICRAKSTKNLKDSSAFVSFAKIESETTTEGKSRWMCKKINSNSFIVHIIHIGDLTLFGFVDASVLLSSVNGLGENNENAYFLVDESGELLLCSPQGSQNIVAFPLLEDLPLKIGNQYSSISKYYAQIHASMYCVMQPWQWLNRNHIFTGMVVVFLGIILGIVAFMYYYINREISRPVKALVGMTEHIQGGDLNYRIHVQCQNRELRSINESMNQTVDELVRLRLDSYERRIRFRDMELKYYQMQIRPHFFLNILTTIHSMNKNGQPQLVNPFVESLYNVIRYMFKAGLHTVSLHEEIEHLKQYTHMQSALHGENMMLFYEIDDSLKEWPIPQMLLHTYVENIYKHTVSHGNMVLAKIQGFSEERDGKTYAHIIIQDTGIGFEPEMLEYLNGELTDSPKPDSIGLMNIKNSLNLMYGDDNLVHYSNIQPHGARIDLMIPAHIFLLDEEVRHNENTAG